MEVADRIHAGSAVSRITVSHGPRLLLQINPWSGSVRGTATAVSLPNGRYVFALLSSPNNQLYATAIAGKVHRKSMEADDSPSRGGPTKQASWEKAVGELMDIEKEFELAPEHYPMFVTFGNMADPTSVKEVKPEHFSAEFGADISLKRVTLGVNVDDFDPHSQRRIRQLLPWLSASPEPSLDPTGSFRDQSLADWLRHGDFVR